MEIGSVGIIGAGLMGSGIAEVCARNGIRTLVTEAGPEQLAAGQQRVNASLERGRQTGKLSPEDLDRISGLLTFTPRLEDFAECDFCVEAIVEQLPAKVTLFEQLDRIVSADAILATNTSALPIIEIARATRRPDRVIGTHFFNPAPVMKLIEVVRSIATSDETLEDTRALGERLGKRIIVAQDRGGFIVNLLLDSVSHPRDPALRVRLRDPRGHRRRDASRLRSSHGTAAAARLHRPRHRAVRVRVAVRGVRQQ